MLRAKAPLRISFAGGGTDVPPFPAQEGGQCLNATITRYAWGTLRPRSDGHIRIESIDLGLETTHPPDDPMAFDGKLDLVKAAVRKIVKPNSQGFSLSLQSSVPPGSGLGSSSTIMVAIIGLLKELRNLPLTDYEIAELAYTIEREDLGIEGGLQDQYAATFGGFNFIEFLGDRVIVNPLRISADVLNELEHNLLLGFTGRTRRSDRIIEDQTRRYQGRDEGTVAALRKQKDLAVEMKNALLRRRLDDFGALLHEAWEAKRQLSPKIATEHVDEIYEEARRHGALGGKITGAGGGGFMLFYCGGDSRHRVAEVLAKSGVSVGELAFELEGLRTWRVSEAV